MNREAKFFGAVAWIATVLLAFVTGRTTAPHTGQVFSTHRPPITVGASSLSPTVAPVTPKPSATPAESYPRYVTKVPPVFRGRWDEIVSDKCVGREARFEISATTVANFEVQSDVDKVKLYSPTEADISFTGYDENKSQYNGLMKLRVVDNGRTLTGRDKDSPLFHKCPG